MTTQHPGTGARRTLLGAAAAAPALAATAAARRLPRPTAVSLPDPLLDVGFLADQRQTERGLVEGDRGVEVVTSDPDMIDAGEHSRFPPVAPARLLWDVGIVAAWAKR